MNNRHMIVALFVAVILTTILLPIGNSKANNYSLTYVSQPVDDEVKHMHHKVITQKEVTQKDYTYWDVPLSIDLQQYIHKLCLQYQVNEDLVYGVIKTESNFNPNAASPEGDIGLFQVNVINFPELHKKLGVTNLFDVYQNVESGIYLLSQLKQKYNDWNQVLIAYNQGESSMVHLVSRGYSFTDYTIKVKNNMESINKTQ